MESCYHHFQRFHQLYHQRAPLPINKSVFGGIFKVYIESKDLSQIRIKADHPLAHPQMLQLPKTVYHSLTEDLILSLGETNVKIDPFKSGVYTIEDKKVEVMIEKIENTLNIARQQLVQLQVQETIEIEINKIEIDIGGRIEELLKEQGKINSIKLNIFAHDSFRPVNQFGYTNGITLERRSNITKKKQYSAEQIRVDNISNNPLLMLIFELVYVVQKENEEMSYVVGWFCYPIGTNPQGPFCIDSEMIAGKGKCYSNRYVFPFDVTQHVTLRCCINTDEFVPHRIMIDEMPQFDSYTPSQVSKDMSKSLTPNQSQMQSMNQSKLSSKFPTKQNTEVQREHHQQDSEMARRYQELKDNQSHQSDILLQQLGNQQIEFEKYKQKVLQEVEELRQQTIKQNDQEEKIQQGDINYFKQLKEFKEYHEKAIYEKSREIENIRKILIDLKSQISEKQKDDVDSHELQDTMGTNKQRILNNIAQKETDLKQIGIGEVKSQNLRQFQQIELLQQMRHKKVNFNLELTDQKKTKYFIIQFLGVKYLSSKFPRNIEFTVHFYDFGLTQTDILTYEKDQNRQEFLTLVNKKSIQGDTDSREYIMKFEMDTEKDQTSLLHYMHDRVMGMSMWDADSQFLYGHVKIPLRDMLRQGKIFHETECQFDIIDTEFSDIKGGVHLLIQNIGVESNAIIKKDHKITRRVISQNPVLVPREYKTKEIFDQESAIRQRIWQYKMNQLPDEFKQNEDFQSKQRIIQNIQLYKQQRKKDVINSALQSFINEDRDVVARFGELLIIPFTVQNNMGDDDITLQLSISDPDHKLKEVQVITNYDEWNYYVNVQKYPRPPSWNILSQQHVMHLQSKEKITILYKFLTFRTTDKEQSEFVPNSEHLFPRQVKILANILNGRIYQGLTLNIQPQERIIDHLYHFDLPMNEELTIPLPELLLPPSTSPPFVHCPFPGTILANNTVSFKSSINETRIPILYYSNAFFSQLLNVQLLCVHSLRQFRFTVGLQEQSKQMVNFYCDKDQTLKFFSDSDIIHTDPLQHMLGGRDNQICLSIQSHSDLQQTVKIHGVNEKGEVTFRSEVIVDTEVKEVKRTETYYIGLNQERTVKLVWENTSEWKVFKFRSSHDEVVSVIDEYMEVEAKSTVSVRLQVKRQVQKCFGKCFILVQDGDDRFVQSIMVNVQYGAKSEEI